MKKIMWLALLSITTVIMACSLFGGKVNVQVQGISNQAGAGSTLNASTLSVTAGDSNEVIFSPETFNVKIIKVEVLQGVLNPTWVTLFEGGNTLGDIVQGVTLVSASGALEISAGTYNGVKLTYDTMWNVTAIASSNDIPKAGISPSTPFVYYDTNGTISSSAEIYFATADLKTELQGLGVDTQYINDLSSALEFDGSLDSLTLNLVFETANMITVWTNPAGGSVDSIQYNEPNLSISIN